MTKLDAEILRKLWNFRLAPATCQHPKLELENYEGVYVNGHYYCLQCGESVVRQLQCQPLEVSRVEVPANFLKQA